MGYEPSRFENDPGDFWKCPICKLVLCDPLQICPNGHAACSACSNKLMAKKCPAEGCHVTLLSKRNRRPDLTATRFLNSLKIGCVNARCSWKGIIEEEQSHLKICTKPISSCPNCSWKGTPAQVQLHTKFCSSRLVHCPNFQSGVGGCPFIGRANNMEAHLKVCSFHPCPQAKYGCHFKGTLAWMEHHTPDCSDLLMQELVELRRRVTSSESPTKQINDHVQAIATGQCTELLTPPPSANYTSSDIPMEDRYRQSLEALSLGASASIDDLLAFETAADDGSEWSSFYDQDSVGFILGEPSPVKEEALDWDALLEDEELNVLKMVAMLTDEEERPLVKEQTPDIKKCDEADQFSPVCAMSISPCQAVTPTSLTQQTNEKVNLVQETHSEANPSTSPSMSPLNPKRDDNEIGISFAFQTPNPKSSIHASNLSMSPIKFHKMALHTPILEYAYEDGSARFSCLPATKPNPILPKPVASSSSPKKRASPKKSPRKNVRIDEPAPVASTSKATQRPFAPRPTLYHQRSNTQEQKGNVGPIRHSLHRRTSAVSFSGPNHPYAYPPVSTFPLFSGGNGTRAPIFPPPSAYTTPLAQPGYVRLGSFPPQLVNYAYLQPSPTLTHMQPSSSSFVPTLGFSMEGYEALLYGNTFHNDNIKAPVPSIEAFGRKLAPSQVDTNPFSFPDPQSPLQERFSRNRGKKTQTKNYGSFRQNTPLTSTLDGSYENRSGPSNGNRPYTRSISRGKALELMKTEGDIKSGNKEDDVTESAPSSSKVYSTLVHGNIIRTSESRSLSISSMNDESRQKSLPPIVLRLPPRSRIIKSGAPSSCEDNEVARLESKSQEPEIASRLPARLPLKELPLSAADYNQKVFDPPTTDNALNYWEKGSSRAIGASRPGPQSLSGSNLIQKMQEKVPNGHSTRPTNLTMNVNRMDQTGPVAFDTNILENISPCCPAKGPPSYISPLVLSSIPREEKSRPTEASLMLDKRQTDNESEESGLSDQFEKPISTDEMSLGATPKGSDKKHVKVISLSSFIKQRNMRRASRSGSKHQGASVSHEPTAFDLGDMFGEENAYPVPALSKPLSIASDQGRSQFPDVITSSMTSPFLPSSVDTESDFSGYHLSEAELISVRMGKHAEVSTSSAIAALSSKDIDPTLIISHEHSRMKPQQTRDAPISSIQRSLDVRDSSESYVTQATLKFLERSYDHLKECTKSTDLSNRDIGEACYIEPDIPFQYTPESVESSGLFTESRGNPELDVGWAIADWSMATLSEDGSLQY